MTYTKSGQYDFLFSVFFCNLVGLISSNLICLLLFQHCCSMYLSIFILKSVYDILNFFSVVMFRVDQAALSAQLFLLISVWLGAQQICTSLSFDKFSKLHRIFMLSELLSTSLVKCASLMSSWIWIISSLGLSVISGGFKANSWYVLSTFKVFLLDWQLLVLISRSFSLN